MHTRWLLLLTLAVAAPAQAQPDRPASPFSPPEVPSPEVGLLVPPGPTVGPTLALEPPPLPAAPALQVTLPLDRPALFALNRRQALEMGAVVLTGAGHLTASAYDLSDAYIPVVIGGWGGYLGYRALTEPGFLGEAGFTLQNLGPAFRDASIGAGVALAGMAVYGLANDAFALRLDMLPLLALYPAWGLTQQFLVQGFVTRHLADAGLSPYAVTPISAATFASVHVPNWALTGATAGLGLAYAAHYQEHRNLWPLGFYHGVLGAAFYVWVLDRNPWQELTQGTL